MCGIVLDHFGRPNWCFHREKSLDFFFLSLSLIRKSIFELVIICIIMLLAMFAVVYLGFRGRVVTNVVRTCSPTPLSIVGNKIC